MVKNPPKDHEGVPSCAVDSIDCRGMDSTVTAGSETRTRTAIKPSSHRLPRMGRHSSGQARVRLSGETHYLGPWGSPEAHAAFAELLRKWIANGKEPLGPRLPHAAELTFTVSALVDQYRAWLDGTQRYHKGGKPTSQRRVAWRALSLFEDFTGAVPVRRLSKSMLIQWRDRLEAGYPNWVRNTINRTVAHVLQMLSWGEDRGLVPAAVASGCATMKRLKRDECAGRREHGRERRAVSAEDVEKVAENCCNQVAAMMRLQMSTAMRPGEICALRWADIDKNGPDGNWIYTVVAPKTQHHGHATRYLIGERAQRILERFPALPTAFIFSPAKRMAERSAARKRKPTHPRPGPRRSFNNRWGTVAYRHHVIAACAAAGVEMFTPHELRHAAITRVIEVVGLTAASAVANHRDVAVTARYYHRGPGEALRAVAALNKSS